MCKCFLIFKGIHSTLAHNDPKMALDLEKQFFFVLVLLKAFIKIKHAHTHKKKPQTQFYLKIVL